ncbi:DNA-binding PadR family transcriptional regulator [Lysinibacillus sp. RC46]|uniref:PadR family transcriptional regulator n=1 Tax=unclassified Lysinibacillus TaxID=2636778 RepID=UPI00351410F3
MKGRDVVLGLLMEKELSGYDIKIVFEDVFTHFFDGSFGMIYPTLRQLEKEGKIKKEVVMQEGKPNKKMYFITDEGREEFYQYMKTDVEKDVLRSDFLMRMYFGNYSDSNSMKKWIEEEIERKEAYVADLLLKYEKWKEGITFAEEISLEVGIASYMAQVKTLKDKLAQLVIQEKRDEL